MPVVSLLVLSLDIGIKKGVVHSFWCATKVNFCGGKRGVFPVAVSGIGFATAPQLRIFKGQSVAT